MAEEKSILAELVKALTPDIVLAFPRDKARSSRQLLKIANKLNIPVDRRLSPDGTQIYVGLKRTAS